MSIEKNRSILLSAIPYRESSLLVYLYSLQYGRINALAKGVRRTDKRGVPLERGYVIEHLVYLKQHRDLHLITDCQIVDHFPGIRGNLEKTAVRDMVFDIIIASIRASDPNAQLFGTLIAFLSNLENLGCGSTGLLFHGAKALFSIAGQLGFYLDFSHCVACGKLFGEVSGASLTIQDGAVRCLNCTGTLSPANRLLCSPIPGWLSLPCDALIDNKLMVCTEQEAMTLVGIAVDYCRHHLDIRKKLDSYVFIEHLFGQSGKKTSIDISETNRTAYYQTANQKEITCRIHQ